jgi:broad specificity phosphatase PhoE
LTEVGREQARLLSRSSWIRETLFGRIYSSDLVRAKETAEILLLDAQSESQQDQQQNNKSNKNNSNINVILDSRLRELSKGAREELPRTMSYEEAYQTRLQQMKNNPTYSNQTIAMPLVESLEQAWNRSREFLNEILADVIAKEQHPVASSETHNKEAAAQCSHGDNNQGPLNEDNKQQEQEQKPIPILIVSHSGLLRIFLQNLVGQDNHLKQHPQARFEAGTGLLMIPNTSVTILQMQIQIPIDNGNYDAVGGSFVKIKELTWAKHLQGQHPASSLNGE